MPSEQRSDANRLLLIDRDPSNRQAMAATLAASLGPFELAVAAGGRQAAEMLRARSYHLVLVDLASLADFGASTEDAVARLVKLAECALLIAVADGASVSAAVAAMRAGAHDYVARPISGPALAARIGDLAQRHGKTRQWLLAVNSTSARDDFAGLVGFSSQMQFVYQQIARIALSPAPVFITGESGTGKELCAEALHQQGARAHKRLVIVHCAAIPRDRMERALFGAARGACSATVGDGKGAVELADGGTLFLDEIGEMDLSLQGRLLRFLQTGLLSRVGEPEGRRADIRVICATSRNPTQLIAERRFREDLFYRLHVLPVHLPPLRQRPTDIPVLARHFLDHFAHEERKRFSGFSSEAADLLAGHDWPGNVRQLQTLVHQLAVMFDGGQIDAEMIAAADIASRVTITAANRPTPAVLPMWQQEQRIIEDAILRFSGNIARAAAALEISPSTIYRKRQNWAEMEGAA